MNPYKVLGVGPDASFEEVRTAYKNLARKYHPDVCKDPDANEKMAKINVAFREIERMYNLGFGASGSGSTGEQDAGARQDGRTEDSDTHARREYMSDAGPNENGKRRGKSAAPRVKTFVKTLLARLSANGGFSGSYRRGELPEFYPRVFVLCNESMYGRHANFVRILFSGIYDTMHCMLFWLFSMSPRIARRRMYACLLAIVFVQVAAYAVEKMYGYNVPALFPLFVILVPVRVAYLLWYGAKNLYARVVHGTFGRKL